MQPAVFLDRDGTLNREVHYLSDPADFELLPGAGPALRRMQQAGFLLVVITNQAGIGRGYFGEDDLAAIHARMNADLARHGVDLDGIYHCPSHPDDGDPDRKPGTGMIDRACAELDIDRSASWMVGDKTIDVLTGQNAGLHTVLVETGYAGKDGVLATPPDAVVADLEAAAALIVGD